MTTAQQTLAAITADTFNCFIDVDYRVAAALAEGTTEVPELSQAQVDQSITWLLGAGYVESVSFTPCFTHPPATADDVSKFIAEPEDLLCGVHTLRFGDVEMPWSFCRQAEVLSVDQACKEFGLTEEQYIAMLVEAGELIPHPNGGYIPGAHPSSFWIERDDESER